MTTRARNLFNAYVGNTLNHPDLKDLGLNTHVFNLNDAARAAHIPASEMVEELGPLARALATARGKL